MSPSVVLVSASPGLEERIRYTAGPALSTLAAEPSASAQALAELAASAPPEVVVLDGGSDLDGALALAALVDARCPATSVVLVTERAADVGLAALRAGVRDVLPPDAAVPEIHAVLDRAARAARSRAGSTIVAAVTPDVPGDVPAGNGRVIGVVSPKGGVGKTTVATNLGVGLARSAQHATVLVDLDVQFGDVASGLNLSPEYTLPDVVHGPACADPLALKTFLTIHETGLYVICGSDSPEDADGISAADVSRLLAMLAREFRYVVVDTAPGLPEHALAAMDQATDLVLVTSMDVPGVRGLRKELETLDGLDMHPDSRHVVLNFAGPGNGMSVRDVEATIGRGVDVLLPTSRAVPVSVNMGVPLLQGTTRDPVAKQLRQLVDRFSPAVAHAPARRGGGRHRRAKVPVS